MFRVLPGATPGNTTERSDTMLYGAFKLAVLKKIDPKINSLTPERKTAGYLNAMVEATNRGLEDLATAGKYITKPYTITQ